MKINKEKKQKQTKKAPKNQGPKNMPHKNNPFSLLLIVALAGAAFALMTQGNLEEFYQPEQREEIALSEFLKKYQEDQLKTVTIKEQEILAEDQEGKKYKSVKEAHATVRDLGLNDPGKTTEVSIKDLTSGKLFSNLLIGLLPLILLIALFVFISRKAGGLMGGDGGPFGFGKSKAKTYNKTKHQTKFADVAGAQEAKEEVVEVVDFLKHPKKYQKAGAKIPKGMLMVGPPGTGKTLIARAIAGEADVPFFSVSGSEFVEMFVGVGASRVRDLFKTAKRNAPSIIFIDEIDAIGKQRGSAGGGGHDEREQTLNQILTEMDGFEAETSVIVIAATNRPDVLDKALLRPGRFDRRIHVDLPDMDAREQILQVHAKKKKLEKSINIRAIASKTVGFSGADLENVMNEAAIASVKNKHKKITQEDLDNSVEKVSLGPARKSRRISDKEKKIIAYHEVGHALAGHFTENCEPVHKISIISRGGALGVTWFLPEEDSYLNSEQKMKDEMVSLHGGRIAERLIFGQTTTGASNDLERISGIARSMIMTYGMGNQEKIGPVVFQKKSRGFAGVDLEDGKDFSEETARIIDKEVQILVQEAENRCTQILKDKFDLLEKISQDLLKKENITREEFLEYLGEKVPEKEAPKAKKSDNN